MASFYLVHEIINTQIYASRKGEQKKLENEMLEWNLKSDIRYKLIRRSIPSLLTLTSPPFVHAFSGQWLLSS